MNTELSLGNKRLLQALQDVIDNPSHHDQKTWHCNTSHCIAGMAECRYNMEKSGQKDLAKYLRSTVYIGIRMPLIPIINHSYFDITKSTWRTIVYGKNTLSQLIFFVHNATENKGHIRIKGCAISLADTNLSNADLSNADLKYADLSNVDLNNADLRGANLSYADLTNADLKYADLRGANLSYADLTNADLKYADLTNADLKYADLSSAILQNTLSLEG